LNAFKHLKASPDMHSTRQVSKTSVYFLKPCPIRRRWESRKHLKVQLPTISRFSLLCV